VAADFKSSTLTSLSPAPRPFRQTPSQPKSSTSAQAQVAGLVEVEAEALL